MAQSRTFSRGKLADFIACQRRFQLRYQEQLAWPNGPLDARAAESLDSGRRFHRLLQRHFLGLPLQAPPADQAELAEWWRRFQSRPPKIPTGKRLPEFNLTVPIDRYFLTGRFDLLILGEEGLHIFDWKSGVRPPSLATLRDDLQTRVYLALVAEGVSALWNDVLPEAIKLTYWYASDPPLTRFLAYDAAWHAENWAYLRDLVQQIERQLNTGQELPLTSDLTQCRRCAYQIFCRRESDGIDLTEWHSDDESLQLEPGLP